MGGEGHIARPIHLLGCMARDSLFWRRFIINDEQFVVVRGDNSR